MKVVLASDSYKECLLAREVCAAMEAGVLSLNAGIETVMVPMADGGDGTLDAVLGNLGGERISQVVTGPLGNAVEAEYGWIGAEKTAIIEAASANGLHLVPKDRRRPMELTTRGVGELLLAALAKGAARIILTVGGSATVEGGTGLARALGYRLLDEAGEAIPEGGRGLSKLARLEAPAERPWEKVRIEVACDVDNPLTGEHGAARVFGPQKGATPEEVELLDDGLARLAVIVKRDLGIEIATQPGAGAAGGLSAGIVAFAGGELRPGIDLVIHLVGLGEALAGADLVICGEGKTDGQTLRGKVCAGVARAARKAGAACAVISGSVTASRRELAEVGIDAAFSICRGPLSLEEALKKAPELIEETTANLVAAFAAGRAVGAASED